MFCSFLLCFLVCLIMSEKGVFPNLSCPFWWFILRNVVPSCLVQNIVFLYMLWYSFKCFWLYFMLEAECIMISSFSIADLLLKLDVFFTPNSISASCFSVIQIYSLKRVRIGGYRLPTDLGWVIFENRTLFITFKSVLCISIFFFLIAVMFTISVM